MGSRGYPANVTKPVGVLGLLPVVRADGPDVVGSPEANEHFLSEAPQTLQPGSTAVWHCQPPVVSISSAAAINRWLGIFTFSPIGSGWLLSVCTVNDSCNRGKIVVKVIDPVFTLAHTTSMSFVWVTTFVSYILVAIVSYFDAGLT